MTGFSSINSSIKTNVKLREDFAASNDNKPKRKKKKRAAPLSIRLSANERAWLEERAGGMPMSTYVKSRLFAANDNAPPLTRGRATIENHKELARIHGKFSRFDVFLSIKGLLKAIEKGRIRLKPQTEDALVAACEDIEDIRRCIMKALGTRAE